MTESLWWKPHLEGWSRAVGMTYTVHAYASHDERRRLGDWWRNGGTWCLHLDGQSYAQFVRGDLSEDVRRSLTWTLQALSALPERAGWQGWRGQLLGLLEQFCGRSSSHQGLSVEHWGELKNLGGKGTLNDIAGLPGYLIWLHFDTQGNPHGKLTDWQSAAEEVIEAVIPGGLIGWSKEPVGNPSAFVLCPVDILSDEEEDPANDEIGSEEGSNFELTNLTEDERLLRDVLLQLVQNLEVDAYLLAEAAVSCRVNGLNNLGMGIATLSTAWQARRWRPASDKVVMWTEQRVLSLLLAVPEPVIQLFLQTDPRQSLELPDRDAEESADRLIDRMNARMNDKSTDRPADGIGGKALPSELAIVLQGVMKANLNVSEAARLLYLHRNTLLHRIERIRQLTGYDIRNFEDALTLWLMQLLYR